jgi:hypothetical protein
LYLTGITLRHSNPPPHRAVPSRNGNWSTLSSLGNDCKGNSVSNTLLLCTVCCQHDMTATDPLLSNGCPCRLHNFDFNVKPRILFDIKISYHTQRERTLYLLGREQYNSFMALEWYEISNNTVTWHGWQQFNSI